MLSDQWVVGPMGRPRSETLVFCFTNKADILSIKLYYKVSYITCAYIAHDALIGWLKNAIL